MTSTYNTADAAPKDYADLVTRYEQLATALGVANVEDNVAADKAAFCSAATSFKATAKAASDKGVRAMAIYAPYGAAGPNGEVGAFLMSPDKDPVLLMLEELGMQILHVDVSQDSNWEYAVTADWSAGTLSATDTKSSGALTGEQVKYPVDFFLADVRTLLDFNSESFAKAWPHPAVTAGQSAYWPSGGQDYSWKHATEILTIVGEKLAQAEKIADGTTTSHVSTTCTQVDVIDSETHRTTGLGPAEYACYNPVEYAWCDALPSAPPPPSGGSGLSTGAVVGIAVGCGVGGLLIGAVLTKLMSKKATKGAVGSMNA